MKEQIIDEGLSEEKGLGHLTTGILLALSNQMAKTIRDNDGHFDLGTYGFVHSGIIDKKYQDKLGSEVYSFWEKLNLFVSVVRSKKTGSAQYIHSPNLDGTYNYGDRKKIELFVSPEDMQNLADEVTKYGPDYSGIDVYFKLYYLIYSPLLHELRHAFDNMRTNGKIFQDKKALKFRSKYNHMNVVPSDEVDPNAFIQKRAKAYVQQPHEIWARASQAMHNLRFTKGIAELGEDVKMVPLEDVIKEFRLNFKNWRDISEKARRRLIKSVANAWQDAKKNLETKELNEMENLTINQELEDEIEMRLLPSENFLNATQIMDIAQSFNIDEMDVAEAVQDFVLKREHEKYTEAKVDIEEFVEELRSNGVRTDSESVEKMTQAFLDAHGNYHTQEMGMDKLVLQNIMRMATKDPNQLKFFEAIQRKIRRILENQLIW